MGGEDFPAQNRRHQGRARPAHPREEEAGDQEVAGPGQLQLDGQPGEPEGKATVRRDLRVVLTPVEDLHVVDAHDRQVVPQTVQVGPGLEIADDHVRPEAAFSHLPVDLQVAREAGQGRLQVPEHAVEEIEGVVVVVERQPVDLVDGDAGASAEHAGNQRVGATGHDDRDLVALRAELVENHLAPRGVTHALADNAIENLHAGNREPTTMTPPGRPRQS